jgi:hypothetical protein
MSLRIMLRSCRAKAPAAAPKRGDPVEVLTVGVEVDADVIEVPEAPKS